MEGLKPRKRQRTVKLGDEGGGRPRDCGHKQRKSTLMKKAQELATLCDVMVCLVCLGPDGEVETWPEDKTLVRDAISKYKELRGTPMLMKKAEERYGLLDLLESKKRKLVGRRKALREKLFSSVETRIRESTSVEELKGVCSKLDTELDRVRPLLIEKSQTVQFLNPQRNGAVYAPPVRADAPSPGYVLIGNNENNFMPMEDSYNQQPAVQFFNHHHHHHHQQQQGNGAVFQTPIWETYNQNLSIGDYINNDYLEIRNTDNYIMLPSPDNSYLPAGVLDANPGRLAGT